MPIKEKTLKNKKGQTKHTLRHTSGLRCTLKRTVKINANYSTCKQIFKLIKGKHKMTK